MRLALQTPHVPALPPTLALEASSTSRRVKPSSLPAPISNPKWTAIWIVQNTNKVGAVWMTADTLPLAPTLQTN